MSLVVSIALALLVSQKVGHLVDSSGLLTFAVFSDLGL